MKGYLSIIHPSLAERLYKENDSFRFEIDRVFRTLVAPTAQAISVQLAGDALFKAAHVYDVTSGRFPVVTQVGSTAASPTVVTSMVSTGQIMRHRFTGSKTISNPSVPNQTALVLGRIVGSSGLTTPVSKVSSTDVGLFQIGTVYSHAAGRRAYFNELPAMPATGSGTVTIAGTFAPPASEEGHYLNDLRIKGGGTETTATYVWRRRPYFCGSYEPGAGIADAYASASNDSLENRFGLTVGNRNHLLLDPLALGPSTPIPSTLPYTLNYPTALALSADQQTRCAGMAWDGLANGRVWWVVVDTEESNDSNASASRSVWTWKRMTGEAFKQADSGADAVSSFPTLGASVQFRDIKAGRGGLVYIAADGDNNKGLGSDTGALIIINANTNAVIAVVGTAAAGIYTHGGAAQNNVLAVAVDKISEPGGVGTDRVWMLSRNGVSYIDVTYATPTVAAAAFVAAGPTGSSLRGLGGAEFSFTSPSPVTNPNHHQGLMDVDTAGNVYWISSPAPSPGGVHRINKVNNTGATHTFLSLDTAAEIGGAGYLQLGTNVTTPAAVQYTCSSISVHRRDTGDPLPDDIWVGGGLVNNTVGLIAVQQIPTTSFSGANPGFSYLGPELTNSTTNTAVSLSVSPDGSVACLLFVSKFAFLESLGRKTVTTVGGTISGAPGPTFTFTAGASIFTTAHVGKLLTIIDSSGGGNDGRWKITAFSSGTVVSIVAVNVTTPANEVSAGFNVAIDVFDSDAGSGQGTMTANNEGTHLFHRLFMDDSGWMFSIYPLNGNVDGNHMLISLPPISYQWSGAVWFRSRYSSIGTARAKTASGSAVALNNGQTVLFDDTGGGPFFVAGEYYTWLTAMGMSKDATQELTWSYDLYAEKTDVITTEMVTTKTASLVTTSGGFANSSTLAGQGAFNPFTSAPTSGDAVKKQQLGRYQLRLLLDGAALTNTQNIRAVTQAVSTTAGISMAIDVGSDLVLSTLRFALEGVVSTAVWANLAINLYSATNAAGPASWTLRNTYRADQDHPFWTLQADAFHNLATGETLVGTGVNNVCSVEVDLTSLFPGLLNTAAQYWKMVIYQISGSVSISTSPVGVVAFKASDGLPAGMTASHYLEKANDSNYLANLVIRAVWIEDSGTGSAARGPSNNQATLTADAFEIVISGVGVGGDTIGGASPNMTLNIASAPFNSATKGTIIGRYVVITGAGTGNNNGTFPITANGTNNQITYTNLLGVAEGFTGTFNIDGIASNDFLRAKIAGTGAGAGAISAPVLEIQTFTASASVFVSTDVGRYISIQAGLAQNQGVFQITRFVSGTQVQYRNAGGAAAAYALAFTVLREYKINTVDSTTQVTFYADAENFSAVDWEVIRPADVRPRDDEGGDEDQARFPISSGEIYVCPVTGHIIYSDTDAIRSRLLHADRYVKVKRGL